MLGIGWASYRTVELKRSFQIRRTIKNLGRQKRRSNSRFGFRCAKSAPNASKRNYQWNLNRIDETVMKPDSSVAFAVNQIGLLAVPLPTDVTVVDDNPLYRI